MTEEEAQGYIDKLRAGKQQREATFAAPAGYDVARKDVCPGCGQPSRRLNDGYWCTNPFCDVRSFRSRTTAGPALSHNEKVRHAGPVA